MFSATRKDNFSQHTKSVHSGQSRDTASDMSFLLLEPPGSDLCSTKDKPSPPPTPVSLLTQSATQGNISFIITLLENGCDVNSIADDGSTALHCAARAGQTETVQLLINRAASLSIENLKGRSPLMEAAVGQHPDCIALLLQNGATTATFEPTWKYGVAIVRDGASFVDHVVRLGSVDLVRAVMQEEALGERYSKVRALAVAAARIGHVAILESLVKSDPEALFSQDKFMSLSSNKKHIVWHAVNSGHVDVVELLLVHSATYKGLSDAKRLASLLRIAARKGFVEICALLLDSMDGVLSDTGETFERALYVATERGHLAVVKTLMAHRHALKAKSLNMNRCLLVAFWDSLLEIGNYLLQFVDRDPAHTTCEELSKASTRLGILKFLLAAKEIMVNDMGRGYGPIWRNKSLLYFAAEHDDIHMAAYVLEHKEFDARSIDIEVHRERWMCPKETALDAAQRLGHTEVANLLISHGAINHNIAAQPPPQVKKDRPELHFSDAEDDLNMQEAGRFESDLEFDSELE